MAMLPKQKVREVHLQCRFCAYYHLNTQNKEYRKNLPIAVLMLLRHEAGRAMYKGGVLQPYHPFEYQSSDSQSSAS